MPAAMKKTPWNTWKKKVFNTTSEPSKGLGIALQDETQWQDTLLNYGKVQVCRLSEKIPGSGVPKRIIAYRYRAEGQLSLDHTKGYRYYALVSNDEAEALSCIEFYNQRGSARGRIILKNRTGILAAASCLSTTWR